jgi:ankyrin repeat protein
MAIQPLCLAVENNHYEAAKLLIEHGANVNTCTAFRPLVFHCAMRKQSDMLKLLVINGATINIPTLGRSIIHDLTYDPNMIHWIIDNGADVNLVMGNRLPLQDIYTYRNSINHNAYEVVSILLSKGAKADINAKDYMGNTPLHKAITTIHPDYKYIKLLIDNGANINAKDNEGRTALYRACDKHYPNSTIVELLIKNGADVNIRAYNGMSPLYEASRHNHLIIVKLLVKGGADLTIKHKNKTAFDVAKYYSKKCKDVVEYLSKYYS